MVTATDLNALHSKRSQARRARTLAEKALSALEAKIQLDDGPESPEIIAKYDKLLDAFHTALIGCTTAEKAYDEACTTQESKDISDIGDNKRTGVKINITPPQLDQGIEDFESYTIRFLTFCEAGDIKHDLQKFELFREGIRHNEQVSSIFNMLRASTSDFSQVLDSLRRTLFTPLLERQESNWAQFCNIQYLSDPTDFLASFAASLLKLKDLEISVPQNLQLIIFLKKLPDEVGSFVRSQSPKGIEDAVSGFRSWCSAHKQTQVQVIAAGASPNDGFCTSCGGAHQRRDCYQWKKLRCDHCSGFHQTRLCSCPDAERAYKKLQNEEKRKKYEQFKNGKIPNNETSGSAAASIVTNHIPETVPVASLTTAHPPDILESLPKAFRGSGKACRCRLFAMGNRTTTEMTALLDDGAEVSLVSEDLVRKLNIKPVVGTGNTTAIGANGVTFSLSNSSASISVAATRWEVPVGLVFKTVPTLKPLGVDCIIGCDSLSLLGKIASYTPSGNTLIVGQLARDAIQTWPKFPLIINSGDYELSSSAVLLASISISEADKMLRDEAGKAKIVPDTNIITDDRVHAALVSELDKPFVVRNAPGFTICLRKIGNKSRDTSFQEFYFEIAVPHSTSLSKPSNPNWGFSQKFFAGLDDEAKNAIMTEVNTYVTEGLWFEVLDEEERIGALTRGVAEVFAVKSDNPGKTTVWRPVINLKNDNKNLPPCSSADVDVRVFLLLIRLMEDCETITVLDARRAYLKMRTDTFTYFRVNGKIFKSDRVLFGTSFGGAVLAACLAFLDNLAQTIVGEKIFKIYFFDDIYIRDSKEFVDLTIYAGALCGFAFKQSVMSLAADSQYLGIHLRLHKPKGGVAHLETICKPIQARVEPPGQVLTKRKIYQIAGRSWDPLGLHIEDRLTGDLIRRLVPSHLEWDTPFTPSEDIAILYSRLANIERRECSHWVKFSSQSLVVRSDASKEGWGYTISSQDPDLTEILLYTSGGFFCPIKTKCYHSNRRELYALFKAVAFLHKVLVNTVPLRIKNILIQTDNKSVAAWTDPHRLLTAKLTSLEGLPVLRLAHGIRERLGELHNFAITVNHLPGIENQAADAISRFKTMMSISDDAEEQEQQNSSSEEITSPPEDNNTEDQSHDCICAITTEPLWQHFCHGTLQDVIRRVRAVSVIQARFRYKKGTPSCSNNPLLSAQKERSIQQLIEISQIGLPLEGTNHNGVWHKHGKMILGTDEIIGLFLLDIHRSQGHSGRDVTYSIFAHRFFTNKPVGKMIRSILNNCVYCRVQKTKSRLANKKAWPRNTGDYVPQVVRLFEVIGCDYAQDADWKVEGQQVYLFIIVDRKSRYATLYPTLSLSSEDALGCLAKFIATYGQPVVVRTDRGPYAKAGIFSKFLASRCIDHRMNRCGYASAFGGWYERLIGLAKIRIRSALHKYIRPYNMLQLSLAFSEAMEGINQRPLLPKGDTYLTPQDLVFGTPSTEQNPTIDENTQYPDSELREVYEHRVATKEKANKLFDTVVDEWLRKNTMESLKHRPILRNPSEKGEICLMTRNNQWLVVEIVDIAAKGRGHYKVKILKEQAEPIWVDGAHISSLRRFD